MECTEGIILYSHRSVLILLFLCDFFKVPVGVRLDVAFQLFLLLFRRNENIDWQYWPPLLHTTNIEDVQNKISLVYMGILIK